MTYIVTGKAICLKLCTDFIRFDWIVELFVKVHLRCRLKFYIFLSLRLWLLGEYNFSLSNSRKNLVFSKLKMNYVLTGSAICLTVRTGCI